MNFVSQKRISYIGQRISTVTVTLCVSLALGRVPFEILTLRRRLQRDDRANTSCSLPDTHEAHTTHCSDTSGLSITVAHYPIVGVRGSAIAVPAGDNFPSDQTSGSHIDARHKREELLESLAESETQNTPHGQKKRYNTNACVQCVGVEKT